MRLGYSRQRRITDVGFFDHSVIDVEASDRKDAGTILVTVKRDNPDLLECEYGIQILVATEA